MPDPSMINDAVFGEITEADVCVADLSYLNPNVFYELGIRHAVQKPVIHIANRQTRIPFDTQGYRAIFFDVSDYHSMEALKKEIAAQLKTIETPGFTVSNPLTQARGRQALALSTDTRDQVIADLQHRLDLLESNRLDSLEFGGVPAGPSRLAQIRAERIDSAIRAARRGRPPAVRGDYLTKLVEALAPFAPFVDAEKGEIQAAGYLSKEEIEKVISQSSGARAVPT